jgi:hypothetical protein
MARIALVAAVLVAWLAQDALAQAPPRRYQPARPTISPYLNLFRPEVSPLPNYYSFVRPQFQERDFQGRQQAINVQQQAEIQTVNQGLLQIAEPSIPSTGRGGTFRNYSHFFRAPTGGAGGGAN